MPFAMNNMFEIVQLQNGTSENSSNVATNNNQQDLVGCDMPPMSTGHACIQSCP